MPTITTPDSVSITIVHVQCCSCGAYFGLDAEHQKRLRQSHDWFYCPSGHQQQYLGETEADRLKTKLKAAEESLARARQRSDELLDRTQQQERRINGYKGVVARTKRRVSKGVCPCCSHKFKDLKEHMAQEHPKWDPEKSAEVQGEKAPQ